MFKYQVREETDKNTWESFLLSQNPGTFLQSWNWGETNRLVGYKVIRLGAYKGKILSAVAQLIHQPAKRGPHYLIPGGHVVNYENGELVKVLLDYVRKVARENGAWFVRVRPDVKDYPGIRSLFKKLGFVSAPMHLHGEHTLILDISKNEKELLKEMRKTTRYLIKKSLTEGFKINISQNSKDVKILSSLQTETVKRHKFVGFSEKLFKAQLETFGNDGQAELFICEKNRIPLVAAIIIFYGQKAFYHHSGSSTTSKRTNASYFTQWEIIKNAREKGIKYYDFWGIAPGDDPKHRFFGVTVFKKGFGGEKVDWLHAHDLPLSPNYWLTYGFETVRRKVRRL
ncbi:hypothetical protein A3H19_01365 [Candidatus Woesebacteria bacterium RIFCSPLOWO2_12_FULL_39_9]|nr:MAG: hypothetical protein A3H19_01365 [Candidatus Woesebacteria bacterium RIFCSPLOWO2_12_FULL_39_9]